MKVHDVELIPPGITVRVHDHVLATPDGPLRCWSYLTVGLGERGNAELVLTLAHEDGDGETGLLADPLKLIKVLTEGVFQGRFVRAGEYTELGKGLFGRAELRGLTYLPAAPLEGIELSHGTLALMLLLQDELALVRQCGPMRVVARLAASLRQFPYPTCSMRNRASAAIAGEEQATILSGAARLWIPGSCVFQTGDWVVMGLPRSGAPRVAEQLGQLPHDVAPAFLTLPPAHATAALVWRPGQTSPSAYAATDDVSTIAGHFCLLVPGQHADEAQIVEDGFAVTFTAATWARVRAALLSGNDVEVQAGELDFALRYR